MSEKDEKEKKDEEKLKELKTHLADPKEVDQIKKDVKEQVEKDLNTSFSRTSAEMKEAFDKEKKDL